MPAKKAPPKPVAKAGKNNRSRIPLDPNSRSSQRLARMTESNMPPKTKDRADRFVAEYLVDFNATQAFIRLSVSEGKPAEEVDLNYAANKGYQMTRWPYVAQKVQEAMAIAEEKNILSRNDILWGIKREMNNYGLGSAPGARVAAMGLGVRVLGMEAPKKIEGRIALRGGIMVVPETSDLDTWEERAAQAQARLKDEVRE